MKPDSEERKKKISSPPPGGQTASRDARRAEGEILSATLAALPLPAAQVGSPCSAGHCRGRRGLQVSPLHPRLASAGGESGVEGDEGGSRIFSRAATQALGLGGCLVGRRDGRK